MSNHFSETELVDRIRQAFINQDSYMFDKHVPEFTQDDKFLGDYFNQLAVEPKGESPPRFYHTFSPFDVVSNKAPHHAVVFEAGEMLLDIDFDAYVAKRTAAMTSVVLHGLGVDSLSDKKILLFGAGRIAQAAIACLKACYPELQEIDVISKSGDLTDISAKGKNAGVKVAPGNVSNISEYDVIVCHTQTTEPVITFDMQIKKGAVITSFISSTEHGELADELFNNNVNVICDWDQTIKGAKEISRSIESGGLEERDIIMLKDLLNGSKSGDSSKGYTIYRSTGTPIQNLAILKLILEK